jgi:CRISPR/Cas system CSM-associated protein Csm3 (group 7 of RAMP superfamily)
MNETIIIVTLKTRTALHVGGSGGDEVTDDLVRRDARGRVFIPGSAVAGPLRAIATRLAPRVGSPICLAIRDNAGRQQPCRCWVCDLFGDVSPQEGDDKGGRASSLWVHDAYDASRHYGPTSVRDGVGIDRPSGAAAREGSVKFDLEVLPTGATFDVRMILRAHPDPDVQKRNEKLLAVALSEWQGHRGTLGGRVARGLGGFDVDQITWHERYLDTSKRLMDFLNRGDNDFLAGAVASTDTQTTRLEAVRTDDAFRIVSSPSGDRRKDLAAYAVARAWVEADITLQFQGPMMINDLARSRRGGFDHTPWKDGPYLQVPWVLPGSSVRGVLRSQAERIARTLATHAAWQAPSHEQYFLEHCPAGDPNNSRRAEAPLANSDCLLTANGVSGEEIVCPVQLDLADQLFGSVRMGSRLIVEDGRLANRPELKAMDFLAIDRFTGGGRESAKFDALVLWKPAFQVRLRLDNPAAWELGWLLLTLRDLHDGLTTLGFGAAKGFGRVEISSWTAKLGLLLVEDFPGDRQLAQELLDHAEQPTDGLWRVLHVRDTDTAAWFKIAEGWVQAFNTEIENFQRQTDPRQGVPLLQSDSYFNGVIDKLYPQEVIHHG